MARTEKKANIKNKQKTKQIKILVEIGVARLVFSIMPSHLNIFTNFHVVCHFYRGTWEVKEMVSEN